MFGCNIVINGSKMNTSSKGYKILKYISQESRTKFDCVVNVLGKKGKKHTRQNLRGYYCVYFGAMVQNKLLTLDTKTHLYSITEKGLELISRVQEKQTKTKKAK